MRNLGICSLLLLVCFFTFCKKKDTTPNPTPINSTNTTTTGSNIYLPASSGGDMCNLETNYNYLDFNGNVTKDSSVFASFYSALFTSTVAPTTINAGTVTLNNSVIPFQSSSNIGYYFTSNLPINITANLTWSVSGSGTVTAFSQVFTPSYPKYTGGNLLPDTCVKANGITINVSGVSNNQNGVSVYLYSGSVSAHKFIYSSGGSVTFTSSDIAAFPVNQPLTISVDFSNLYTAIVGGIKRGFSNNVIYQKISYLK